MADAGLQLGTAPGRWVLAAAVLGSAVVSLDMTIINVALPTIARSFDASVAGLTWTVNGYTLTLAALILLGGSLGDRYGRRRIFVIGVAWFGVASLLCGIAPTLPVLIAARIVQGIGGALLMPGSLALISASFSPATRGRAIGIWAGLGGLSMAAGPLMAGLLLNLSWRLVFLINLPLTVFVVVIAIQRVPESLDAEASVQLDLPGALAAVVGLAGITFALTDAPEHGAGSPIVIATAAAGLAGLAGFVLIERHSRHPLVPLDIFASRQFTAANLMTLTMYAALGGVILLLALELQLAVGFSPLQAGLSTLPMTAIMLTFSARSGELGARIGPRRSMTIGPVVAALGLLLMLRIEPGSSYVTDVLPAVVVFGAGVTTLVAPLTATVLAAAAARHAGVASGVNNAVARTAGLLSVAVLPAVTGLTGDAYRDPERMAAAFRIGIACCIGLALVSAVIAWFGISDQDHATAQEAGTRADMR